MSFLCQNCQAHPLTRREMLRTSSAGFGALALQGLLAQEGQAASAPVRPRVLMKMLVTTIISAVIMGLVVAFVEAEVFDFRAYFTSRD